MQTTPEGHNLFIVSLPGIFCLVFRATTTTHGLHFLWMCPGPFDFGGQVFWLTRIEKQSGDSILDNLLHHPNSGSDYWDPTCKSFHRNQPKCFVVPFRRPYQEASTVEQSDQLLMIQAWNQLHLQAGITGAFANTAFQRPLASDLERHRSEISPGVKQREHSFFQCQSSDK